MNRQRRKKARELQLLAMLLDRGGIAAQVVDDDRETPDFLLSVDGRIVGVEVTEIFVDNDGGPDNPAAIEANVDRVVAEAWKFYRDQGGRPVHASFGFHTGMVRNMRRRDTAQKLAAFVAGLELPKDRHLSLTPYSGDPFPDVPELAFLNLLAVERWELAVWTSPKAGFVAPLTAQVLQEAIDRKRGRIDDYRAAAPEVWLLIGTSGHGPSQFFELHPSEDLRSGLVSPFDRTYLLHGFAGRVIELGRQY